MKANEHFILQCFGELEGKEMNLDQATEENMRYLLHELAERLHVVNRSIMDPEDYDLAKYDDLKFMYDIVNKKGQLSASETQAFIQELAMIRK